MSTPVAIYLQDAHPIREGMEYVQYAEKKVSMLFGRPTAALCVMR